MSIDLTHSLGCTSRKLYFSCRITVT